MTVKALDPTPSGYSIVAVDADAPPTQPVVAGGSGALVVVRRGGVPIGSRLLHRTPPATVGELLTLVERRPDEPPVAHGAAVSITVAVCTKDRPELLARCLASVADSVSFAAGEVDADVLVVDNASRDDRTRAAALAAGARCEREDVPGLDVARNRAVGAARGEIIVFVDDDVVVDPAWVRTLARTFGANPDAVAVTGQVLALRLDTPAQVEFERTGGFSLGWTPLRLDRAVRHDLPFGRSIGVGCNMAFRRSLLDRIGPFDDALDTGRPMPGAGDLDILVRSVLAGTVVYEPSVVVFHDHRTDFEALRYQFYTWGKCWAVLLVKWYRLAPDQRPQLRWSARRSLRRYARDVLLGPHGKGVHRRGHAALMIVGFAAGTTGAYGRSQRRMAQRRAAVLARPAGGAA